MHGSPLPLLRRQGAWRRVVVATLLRDLWGEGPEALPAARTQGNLLKQAGRARVSVFLERDAQNPAEAGSVNYWGPGSGGNISVNYPGAVCVVGSAER